MVNNLAACLHHPTHQVANLFSLHIQQEGIRHVLHHMKQLMAEAILVFPLGSTPSDDHHALSYANVGVGDTLVWFPFKHEIEGIFERNALASQIPKTPSNFNGIPRPHIIHHMNRPIIPFQVNLLLSHNYTLSIINYTLLYYNTSSQGMPTPLWAQSA